MSGPSRSEPPKARGHDVRRRLGPALGAVLVTGLLQAAMGMASGDASPDERSRIDWRGDLEALVAGVEERHPDPYHSVTREDFRANSAALAERAAGASHPRDVVVAVAELVASVGETHTYLDWPVVGGSGGDSTLASGRYPFRAARFADGIWVTHAGAGYEELVGRRVVRLGDRDVENVLADVAQVTGADNEWTHRFLGPRRLPIVDLMIALGAAGSDGRLHFTIEDAEGRPAVVSISPSKGGLGVELPDRRSAEALAASLYWREPERAYWFEELAAERRLYVQLNRVVDGEEESLDAFARRLDRAIGELRPERVVVDLRRNIGGNSRLARPVVRALVRSEAALARGGIVVLIGPSTISAATVFAEELAQLADVVFVGSPTGSNRNQWGDNAVFELPSSGLRISVSTAFYQTGGPYAVPGPIEPRVFVESSGADYFAVEDPVLRAAWEWSPDPPPADVYAAAIERGEDPLVALADFVGAETRRFRDFERELRLLARRLSEAGDATAGLGVADLLVERHPGRARAHMARGAQLAELGRNAEAVAAWRRGRDLIDADPSLYPELRRRLREFATTEIERLAAAVASRAGSS